MKKRILSILLALCMLFCLVPTTAFAADCAEDLVDPVIWIHLSSDGGGYYDVLMVHGRRRISSSRARRQRERKSLRSRRLLLPPFRLV